MTTTRTLSAVFLEDAVRRGRTAFPEITLEDAVFLAWLTGRVDPEAAGATRVEDLWLACAAAHGDTTAIAAVEARCFPDVNAALRKMGIVDDRIAEVKQGLRKLLFVGDGEGKGPRIGEYRGTGDLKAWMRVSAMRAALKLIRKDGREVSSTDDAVLEARAGADDPELKYMKAAYRAAFKKAFQEALDSLDAQEKILLKQQIIDGLGIDELGALHDVHRATAARWVAAAREKLLTRTRRTFMMNARISKDECESIMRLVQSQLDVSLHRKLSTG